MKKNEQNFLLLFTMWLSLITLFSCAEDENFVGLDSINLSADGLASIYLDTSEVQTITVSTDPVGASQPLIWSSSDANAVAVQASGNGLVGVIQGGLGLGESTVTVQTEDGALMQTMNVEVLYKVHNLGLEEVPVLFSEAQTSYKVQFDPATPTNQQVIWTSSDEAVATVDQNGHVSAVSAGVDGAPLPVIITAHTTDIGMISESDLGSDALNFVTASIELTVSGDPAVIGLLYCTVSGANSYNADQISTSGADSDISHSAGQPAGNYGFYEEEVLVVQPGGSFDIQVTQSNNWSRSLVWVDWNGDKDFSDDGELVSTMGLSNQLNDGPFNATISVPEGATAGEVRMRVLTGDAWENPDETLPCGSIAFGTIKDFPVEVGGLAYCDASGAGAYHADVVSTTGANTNIDYSSSLPAGNYEFITNESISVQAGGSFDLTVTNSNGWSRTIVWVDWNADGDFEDSDEMLSPLSAEAHYSGDDPISYMSTVNAPAGATLGKVRMRVLTGDAWTYDDASIPAAPCGDLADCSIKDFGLIIF